MTATEQQAFDALTAANKWIDEARPLLARGGEMERDLAAARNEALVLSTSIWRKEFQAAAPNWKPLDSVAGIISQIDNMYAGVRQQRDEARFECNALRAIAEAHAAAQAETVALLEESLSILVSRECIAWSEASHREHEKLKARLRAHLAQLKEGAP